MYFRNLQIFRLAAPLAGLAELMATNVFQPCSALARQSQGWVPPRGNPDELVFEQSQQQLIALGVEQKMLPVSVIRQYAQERAKELEETQGFKPGRKQMRDIFDACEAEMLPRAFCKRRITYVWIDPINGWLVVDAASSAKADEVIEHLKITLGELPLTLFRTIQAPGTAMTTWLSLGEIPGPFSIDQDCDLRTAGEAGGSVRYLRHALDAEEINQHINRGKVAGKLAITWNDRISFVLTEQMQIKRVAFLDVLKEQAEQAGNGADQFEADFAIMAGELAGMLASLTDALGGLADTPTDTGDVIGGEGDSTDPLYPRAVDLVQQSRKPSVAAVQRHLMIRYDRAAKMLEQMEQDGIVARAGHGFEMAATA